MVVEGYLSGKSGGIVPIAKKYNIPIEHEKIKNYIDYYNNKKIQKSLCYLTPIQFKQKQLKKKKVPQ